MTKEKKTYIRRTFNLSPELVKRLDEYSEQSGVVRTFVVEKALRQYLDKMAGNDSKD